MAPVPFKRVRRLGENFGRNVVMVIPFEYWASLFKLVPFLRKFN